MPLKAVDLPLLALSCCAQEFEAGGAIGVEVLRALSIHVDRVFVVGVAAVVVVVVIAGVVIGVVVTIAIVVAAVVVAAVPGRITVVSSAVINDRRAMPAAVPTAVSPSATSAAHHRSDRDSSTERKHAGRNHVAGGVYGSNVAGNHVGIAVNHRGVVLRNVNNLRVGRLNDDRLRRLLHDRDL